MAVIILDGVAAGGVSAYALTDIAKVRAVTGITVAMIGDDTLGFMIDSVTSALESECDRHFIARDYSEWLDGSGMRYQSIDEWPLNSVSRVTIGALDAISVTCNDPLATEAYAEVNMAGTMLRLTILDGANAGTVDLSFAAYKTIAELAAEVSATAGGWTGLALSAYGGYRSAVLRPCGRRECYGNQAYFQMPDEGEADYNVDYEYGQILLLAGARFPRGLRNVYSEYNAGYATAPKALELICIELVAQTYRTNARDMTLKSESLGDYSWTAADFTGSFDLSSDAMQRRLAPFKNNII